MKPERITRLVQLIGLLQSGRRHRAEFLARECRVSKRTLFRDLDALREAGVPIECDDQAGGYHLPGANYLPPTSFTPDEALALVVLCHELGNGRGLPFYGPALRAGLKIESSLPQRLREYVREAGQGVRIQMPPTNPLEGIEAHYQALLYAVRRRRAVRIHYDSLTEWRTIGTKLLPYQLLFSRRSWYVIGRSSLHRSVRTFNVGRIEKLEPLEEVFPAPRGFRLERYVRNAWHLIPERGPDRQVWVHFRKQVAQNVAEVRWHRTQQTSFRPDGSLDFRVTVSGLGEITWWILGYGDQAEVVEPLELRRRVAGHAQRLVAQYGQSPA